MLRDIGRFLAALGEIPGLKFLRTIGNKLSRVGYQSDRIMRSGKRVKERISSRDKDDAA